MLADLSITYEQILLGLSNKSSIKENEGMLFVLNRSSRRGFWMKDMKFTIDVIWLETVAGFADKQNLKVGNTVFFELQYS